MRWCRWGVEGVRVISLYEVSFNSSFDETFSTSTTRRDHGHEPRPRVCGPRSHWTRVHSPRAAGLARERQVPFDLPAWGLARHPVPLAQRRVARQPLRIIARHEGMRARRDGRPRGKQLRLEVFGAAKINKDAPLLRLPAVGEASYMYMYMYARQPRRRRGCQLARYLLASYHHAAISPPALDVARQARQRYAWTRLTHLLSTVS